MRAYDYTLPPELIAQQPAAQRDASRLLLYQHASGVIAHHVFRELPDLVRPDDVFVINDCRVIPARLYARRADTGTEIELLLTECTGGAAWLACVKPGRSCRPGVELLVAHTRATVRAQHPDGRRLVEFACTPAELHTLLDTHGIVPLPPYIKRPHTPSAASDRSRYQTVYAAAGCAVAAPTAGLHFTPELLERLRARGCAILPITLNVGLGTFQPVKGDDARTHEMHSELVAVSTGTADALNAARAAGRRIIAVGTTALRALESCYDAGVYKPGNASTCIFIHPPDRVRAADLLLTNFHLPRSTLLMLVAAMIGPAWRTLYDEAVRLRYRFYSYGDAMLLDAHTSARICMIHRTLGRPL